MNGRIPIIIKSRPSRITLPEDISTKVEKTVLLKFAIIRSLPTRPFPQIHPAQDPEEKRYQRRCLRSLTGFRLESTQRNGRETPSGTGRIIWSSFMFFQFNLNNI